MVPEDKAGAPLLRGTYYEIGERKQLEARLLALNETLEARVAELREEARTLEVLNRTGIAIGAELDLERLVQIVTDAGVELSGAAFGAFFYNVVRPDGEAYTLYTLSGAPQGSLCQVSDAAQHGSVRTDLSRQRPCPLSRYSRRSALWQERTFQGNAARPSAGTKLSRGPGDVSRRRSSRRLVLRPSPAGRCSAPAPSASCWDWRRRPRSPSTIHAFTSEAFTKWPHASRRKSSCRNSTARWKNA